MGKHLNITLKKKTIQFEQSHLHTIYLSCVPIFTYIYLKITFLQDFCKIIKTEQNYLFLPPHSQETIKHCNTFQYYILKKNVLNSNTKYTYIVCYHPDLLNQYCMFIIYHKTLQVQFQSQQIRDFNNFKYAISIDFIGSFYNCIIEIIIQLQKEVKLQVKLGRGGQIKTILHDFKTFSTVISSVQKITTQIRQKQLQIKYFNIRCSGYIINNISISNMISTVIRNAKTFQNILRFITIRHFGNFSKNFRNV
eukprot:TRINITY_DN2480_c1_g1_i4.p1 TRINITY_DN2480_c1_g1~~TRINITY_DN2480_c1_g1_i4.p1  ORF type:complete len:251 (+),score=-19.80 TRINITY_DN2480_c1_g1_i4:221-973(+)